MAKPPQPLFLAKESYRRRRLGDAARLLPFLGLALLMLPALWQTTAAAMIYIFVVWAFLIVLVAILSHRLLATEPDGGETRTDPPAER